MYQPAHFRGNRAEALHWILFLAFWGGISLAIRADDSSSAPVAASGDLVKLAPLVVHAPQAGGFSERLDQLKWKLDRIGQGKAFHLRGGQIVDAIVFRNSYLTEHPQEQAVVIVISDPRYGRVTQAAAAYTRNGELRIASSELGDILLPGLTAADIREPDKIKSRLGELRAQSLRAYEEALSSLRNPISKQQARLILRTPAIAIAHAEETNDYMSFDGNGLISQTYLGTDSDEMADALHWLNQSDSGVTIPYARGQAKISVIGDDNSSAAKQISLDVLAFDWDGAHYLYNPQIGTLARPIPRNPVTGLSYLIIRNGDVLEAIYFVATFSRRFPQEKAVFLPPLDRTHAAAAYSFRGQTWILSPFLGRFMVSPKYAIGEAGALAKLHQMLVARELAKGAQRTGTGIPEELPGDDESEQVRRAYAAMREAGLSPSLFTSDAGLPGIMVSYAGVECTYVAAFFGHDQSRTLSSR